MVCLLGLFFGIVIVVTFLIDVEIIVIYGFDVFNNFVFYIEDFVNIKDKV